MEQSQLSFLKDENGNPIWQPNELPSFLFEGDNIEVNPPNVISDDFEASLDLDQVSIDFNQLSLLTYSVLHKEAYWHSEVNPNANPNRDDNPNKAKDANYNLAWSLEIGYLVSEFDINALRKLMHEDSIKKKRLKAKKDADISSSWGDLFFMLAIMVLVWYKVFA